MTAEKLLEGCEHDGSFIPVREVKILMQKYACFKCLEAIKNTRYAAIEIVCQDEIIDTVHAIHNIPDQDVMPEL